MTKLLGIQALRGVAALAVVAYHAARHLGKEVDASAITRLTQPGHAGVDLFFVLSGFIILHVHGKDIGRPKALARYAWQRFARLLPIYWIAMTAAAVLMLPHHSNELTLVRIGLSASLLPIPHDPLLGISWTLQHEVLFYFAVALLICNKTLGLSFFVFWIIWAVSQNIGIFPKSGPDIIASAFNIEFLFGMAAAVVVHHGWIKHGGLLALVAAGGLIAVGVTEVSGLLYGYGNLARLAYGVPSAVLVAALAVWEGKRQRKIPLLPIALGEASYSLYLFHLLGIAVGWQIWLRTEFDSVTRIIECYAFLVVSALTCGLAAYYFVEAPLLRYLRRRASSWFNRTDIDGIVLGN
ncbi:acyltransferase family protein [Novosphingobium barchaimii]|uniref:acyltransferase family protein n=1 Tax=Novosphingobium barchaimii TaxID=1420591 RepID=UPI0009EB3CA4|nr:acyltransferase [Novosphingobium barchaimii]